MTCSSKLAGDVPTPLLQQAESTNQASGCTQCREQMSNAYIISARTDMAKLSAMSRAFDAR